MDRKNRILEYNFKVPKIRIVPLADLHIGASGCDIKAIKQTIEFIKMNDNTYTVLVGDIIDNAVLTGKNLGIYDNYKTPIEQVKEAVELLKPIENKILGAVSGNHEARSERISDINPMYLICAELGILDKYKKTIEVIKIGLGARDNNAKLGRRQTYTILLHHGIGTAENIVKKGNSFINTFEGVDAIVLGHTHNVRTAKFNKKVVDSKNNLILDKETTVIVCNSYLKDSDYALKSMLQSTSISQVSFTLQTGIKKILVEI